MDHSRELERYDDSFQPNTSPGSGDAVNLAGASGVGQYVTIGGNGSAASLTASGNVLLKGQVTVAGKLSLATATGAAATLALNNARMTAATAAITGRLEAESASIATVSSLAMLTGGTLLSLGGSAVQLGGLIANGSGNVLAIDANSAPEDRQRHCRGGRCADTGGGQHSRDDRGDLRQRCPPTEHSRSPAAAALFIDLSGTAESDSYAAAPTISGTGTFSLTENSTLGLGVADTAAIRFAGPNATLVLATPSAGAISGFHGR